MRLHVSPDRPGVSRARRSLELWRHRKPRAAWCDDEVAICAAVRRRVRKDVADIPLRLSVGVRCRCVERQVTVDVTDVALDAVDPRVLAVVDLGEAVGAQESELERFPDLMIDSAVPA